MIAILWFLACSLVLVVCVVAGVATWRVVGEAYRETEGYWTQGMLDMKRRLKEERRMIEYQGPGYRGRVATVTQSGRWIATRKHRSGSITDYDPDIIEVIPETWKKHPVYHIRYEGKVYRRQSGTCTAEFPSGVEPPQIIKNGVNDKLDVARDAQRSDLEARGRRVAWGVE